MCLSDIEDVDDVGVRDGSDGARFGEERGRSGVIRGGIEKLECDVPAQHGVMRTDDDTHASPADFRIDLPSVIDHCSWTKCPVERRRR